LRITELQDLLEVHPHISTEWKITKSKVRSSEELECIELRLASSPNRALVNPRTQICIGSKTHELLRDFFSEIRFEEERSREFADYRNFGKHSYPHLLKLNVNGKTVLKVTVASLREATFPNNDFKAPNNAIARRQCDGMSPPHAAVNPHFVYHPEDKNNNGGTIIVGLTVLADGTVENVQILESGGNEIDQAVLKAINEGKFEPARCGKDAVTADFQYQFTYNGSPLLPSY
jgi:TonB family protein